MNMPGGILYEKLANIVGAENAFDAPEVLRRYSSDCSFAPVQTPTCVAWLSTRDEVQKVVKVANEENVPLIPRSSGFDFTGGGVPSQGGMVLDMSRMKKIIEIDPRNRMARIEPGVTYGQLQVALAQHNLMSLNPLLPHATKSVLTSHLERDPMLITKYEYGDPLLTMEVVLPTGDVLRTGSASAPGAPDNTLCDLVGPHGPALDFNRLFQGAQGTFGIVTWMAIKVEHSPKVQKLFFIPFNSLKDLVEPIYRIQRNMLGNECFVLDSNYLASILAKNGEIEELKASLPPWTLILCVTGGPRRPEERIEYEEERLYEIGADFGLNVSPTLPGSPGLERIFSERLRQPWPEDMLYWKWRSRSASSVISFHTLLERVPALTQTARDYIASASYPVEDMGSYLQPLERARACFCEYGLSYDPTNPREISLVKELYTSLSEFLFKQGALFTRPYGSQAQIVYGGNLTLTNTLRRLKKIFDPNNIMNPGKLCF